MSNCSIVSINEALLEFSIALDFTLETGVERHLVNDTRVLVPHDIFCAVIGTDQDGRAYIDQALQGGADLVVAQCTMIGQHGQIQWRDIELNGQQKKVAIVYFYQLDFHLFALAKNYYHNPQASMTIIGITGTNGKTSTSQIIANLLESCAQHCGVIGTNGAGSLPNLQPLANTTPGATELHRLLQQFNQQKMTHVAMEVSSHALSQHRITAESIDVAVFTNLTRDHLDYHQSMEAYAEAKYQLFSHQSAQIAIINGDDSQAKTWLNNWPSLQPVIVYGKDKVNTQFDGYVQASDIKHTATGVSFVLKTHLGKVTINSPLMGDFNVDNLLAAIAVLITQNIPLETIAKAVKTIKPIIGRMEPYNAVGKATTIVDYAHTPDALQNALRSCQQHCRGELWVVFGCGGDRDKGKRALMGEVAELLADHIILTNDNPRTELPENIVKDILSGCQQPQAITVILDRHQAVLAAISQAKEQDVILLAGKGHEDYIQIGNKKIYYNERSLVQRTYASLTNEVVS